MGQRQSHGKLPQPASVTVQPKQDNSIDAFEERKKQPFRRAQEADCAVVVVDRNQRVLYANPHVYRYLGHLPQDVVGGTIDFLFPEKFRKWHSDRFEAYIKRQQAGRAWIASDIMDRARIETVITKNEELIQVVMMVTDMGRQPRPEDPQFILTFKPHVAKRTNDLTTHPS